MGLLSGPGYAPAPVDTSVAIGRWAAAKTRGGAALAGGEVVLTPEYLVFTPWDMDQTRAFLVKALGKAGVPYVGEVDKLITTTTLLEPVALRLDQIAAIMPLGRASWLKPPHARIELTDGRSVDLGVLAGPRRLNKDPANNDAFDDWLAKVDAQRGRASREPS